MCFSTFKIFALQVGIGAEKHIYLIRASFRSTRDQNQKGSHEAKYIAELIHLNSSFYEHVTEI